MSATHFPSANLTFAIIYGCSLSVEKEIVQRLTLVNRTVPHPLLIPGIFAELERSRHAKLVTSMSVTLESRILRLRFNPEDLERGISEDRLNEEKRTAWLDTAYLRNGLESWKAQLGKMVDHIHHLERSMLLPRQKDSDVQLEVASSGLSALSKVVEEMQTRIYEISGALSKRDASSPDETFHKKFFPVISSPQKQPRVI